MKIQPARIFGTQQFVLRGKVIAISAYIKKTDVKCSTKDY
jgi:hypothetical protein